MEIFKRLFVVVAYASVLPVCITCGSSMRNENIPAVMPAAANNYASANVLSSNLQVNASASYAANILSATMANQVKTNLLPREVNGDLVVQPAAEFVKGTIRLLAKK